MALEDSILKSTKKILGLSEEYTVFDYDICTHINAALSVLSQLGVIGPSLMPVEDDTMTWAQLLGTFEFPSNEMLGLVKPYIYLKVKMLFDPPQTSYLIEAMERQIAEKEWRLNHAREMNVPYLEVAEEESV